MRFAPLAVEGVVRVSLEPIADDRGSFARVYDEDAFRAQGLMPVGVQCSLSRNPRRHTLRGMHYQIAPSQEAKLVRCLAGRIWDVALDLRRSSPTYLRWAAAELDAAAGDALYIPPGCAHGFLTLSGDADVLYMMADRFAPDLARGVRWNDPAFAIAWPAPPALIGPRDAAYPDYVP